MNAINKLSAGQLNRLSEEEAARSAKRPVVLVLDSIRSALNVGSVFRTADAFGIEAIYLCGITAQPPHREILKTALGATLTVRWNYFSLITSALRELKNSGFEIIAVEHTTVSVPLNRFRFKEKTALVLGNEIDGVSSEALALCDAAIEIPQHGMKHSLNVAVCAGIVLWEFIR